MVARDCGTTNGSQTVEDKGLPGWAVRYTHEHIHTAQT